VTNPNTPQDAPTVEIELHGSTPLSNFIPVPMLHGPLNTAALLIIGWDKAEIRQATPASGAINTIFIVLSTYGSLVSNSGRSMNITIAGLRGANTSSGLLPISSDSHQNVFAGHGVWNQTAGQLIITAITTTEAHVAYSLSFILQNPVEGQDAPYPIEASAGWPISALSMTRGNGTDAPLGVHSFLRAWIEQSDPGAGANNTFILQLKSRMQLPSSPLDISVTTPGSAYIAGDLIANAGVGSGFRAAFDVVNRGISSTRILSVGSGYTDDVLLTPVYSGTTKAMTNSISIVQIVAAGKYYLTADLRAIHPVSGQGFFGRTSVNETDGSLVAIHISNHGKDYGDAMFLTIVQYYPNTLTTMENTITGIDFISPASTSNCQAGMVISTVGGSGNFFRAIIERVHYLTGACFSSVFMSAPNACVGACQGLFLSEAETYEYVHVCILACVCFFTLNNKRIYRGNISDTAWQRVYIRPAIRDKQRQLQV